ncbi:unnamed protein product [Larinioides sclopetarius]|uniref:Uncharacterized protein n=1 Tax=Larinioides sclopetarius TaxID=280406 RepID=A0AAV1Z2R4_9ARAC
MLELLMLLPLLMVGLLNMTFQVSVDEVTDVRRDVYFNYRKYDDDQYLKVQDKVIYLNLVLTDKGPDLVPECSTAEVERHLKCGCACAIKKEDCTEKQVYDPAKCRCECKNVDEKEKCHQLQNHWDPANCQCMCPPEISQLCSTGFYFHHELCRCVPVSESYPESGMRRRRRPPV